MYVIPVTRFEFEFHGQKKNYAIKFKIVDRKSERANAKRKLRSARKSVKLNENKNLNKQFCSCKYFKAKNY